MKSWERSKRAVMCGGCSQMVAVGDPVAWLSADGQTWKLLRCAACMAKEGELAPDLDPLPAPVEARPTMTPIGKMAFDWKLSQAGREPGEDDA